MNPRILFIVGPTASGKSKIAMQLAKRLGGEIVSADSMQVYRGMDTGTAKPSKADRKKIPHHLLDVRSPAQPFSVFDYRRLALAKIRAIVKRGKLPVVTGGSGLYVRALLEGWTAKNRTLESLGFQPSVIGIAKDRTALYAGIEKRVDQMFRKGLVREVEKISKKKLSLTASQAVGYKEILNAFSGNSTLEEARALIKKNTRRLAKRQLTWFRKERGIQWVAWEDGDTANAMRNKILKLLSLRATEGSEAIPGLLRRVAPRNDGRAHGAR